MALERSGTTASHEEGKERLLVEAAQKDPARFAQLYELNFERVYAYVVRRVRERGTAEDLTSEVFHKALAHLPQSIQADAVRRIRRGLSRDAKPSNAP